MADAQRQLWAEIVSESFEDHGISATADQIAAVASDVQGAHENWDMAFSGPSPGWHDRELAEIKRQLAQEREKVTCRECRGTGSIIEYFASRQSIETCWKCGGEGRHAP